MDASRKTAILVMEFVTILVLMSALGSKSDNCALKSLAQKWMDTIDTEFGRREELDSQLRWDYRTNVTPENKEKYEKIVGENTYWLLNKSAKAIEFLQKKKDICNSTVTRMLRLFTLESFTQNPEALRDITRRQNEMVEIFNNIEIKRNDKVYRLYPDLSNIMKTSRDYDELLWAWGAWYNTTGRRLKTLYAEFVEKLNNAAKDGGYADMGVYWKVMDFDQVHIEREMDQLLEGLMPFYKQLHAYARKRLARHYRGINKTGFIPAHLLGDMWAQEWNKIEDILLPFPNAQANYNITKAMLDQGYTPIRMFQLSEEFFVSLGLEPMTSDFWNKSMLVQPTDGRRVLCQGAATDFYRQTDFRIRICTKVTSDDLQIVHHEMGHVEYYMLYRHQPNVFRRGANAAFHEAVGDTITLSVMTDTHLATINLIPSTGNDTTDSTKSQEQEINSLMRMALQRIAFIPFMYVIDKWRYMVFRGEITPDNYTSSWWRLRERYNGIMPPVARSINDFDPGVKFHFPQHIPFSRYFFSYIGQFQFHSELCKEARHNGPLHKCDIFGSKEAGRKLRSALSLGASKPWEEVMEMLTGQRRFQIQPLLQYFQPLIDWLKKDNRDEHIGWK